MTELTTTSVTTTPPDWAAVAGDKTLYVLDAEGTEVRVTMTRKAGGFAFEADTADLALAAAAVAYAAECEAFLVEEESR